MSACVRSITAVLDAVNMFAKAKDWNRIDLMLSNINANEDLEILVMYLRATYPMRSFLTRWDKTAADIKYEIIQREGEDCARRLMQGLPVPTIVAMKLK